MTKPEFILSQTDSGEQPVRALESLRKSVGDDPHCAALITVEAWNVARALDYVAVLEYRLALAACAFNPSLTIELRSANLERRREARAAKGGK